MATEKSAMRQRLINVASMTVILLAVAGAIIGSIHPGKLTGLLLPIALTLWWLLYKVIRRAET